MRTSVAVWLVLVLLCCAIYLPGLSNEFVWDDELFITRNPPVSDGLSAASLRWAFTTFHTGNWYPLTWISHLLDVELFGLKPRGHHLTSLLIHCANAVLTLLVLQRMTGALWGSALVAALFAVHPLHVESVAWAAERKDVLSTLLWLLALLAWLGWLRMPRPARLLAAVVLYAAALMAKSMPVTFPFLLLLLDWWPLGRFLPGRRGAVVAEKAPLFVLAGISGAVTYLAQASVGAVGSVPFLVRLINAFLSYCTYILKTLLPIRLALLYPFPMEQPSLLGAALAVAALGAITIVVLRARRRSPAPVVGWFWFLGTLVPVIGLVQVGRQAMADRYTYVPLTGLFLMAVWGIPWKGRWGIGGIAGWGARGRMPWPAAGAATVVVLFAVTARAQVKMWRDPIVAFTNAIRVTKDNLVAHDLLAGYHYERGDDRLAEEHARAAIALSDEDAGAHCTLALVLEKRGKIEEAMAEYRAAIRADPRAADAHNNLGALLFAAGEQAAAERHLRQALALNPALPGARSNLGKLLAHQGRIEEALPCFREAVRLSPRTALYHADLGAALAALGRPDDGLPELREALRLDPKLEVARENLAKALSRKASHGD